ncbi:MAG: Plug domain-containing protein [Aliidongia sp.]
MNIPASLLSRSAVSVLALTLAVSAQAQQPAPAPQVENITVTASREDQIGIAETASQGSVTQEELDLRPVYRVGQLLESVPGLVVTVHSGEAKAYQYLLRGVNLDHGIDFANFLDDMPVNRPSNAHGQGYSDLNFAIPQLLAGVDYTKGPYFAGLGDFGSVGSEHMRLLDDLPDQLSVSAGTLATTRSSAAARCISTMAAGCSARPISAASTGPTRIRIISARLRWRRATARARMRMATA